MMARKKPPIAPRPLRIVMPGHPLEVVLLLAGFLSGGLSLVTDQPASQSVYTLLPQWHLAWSVSLFVGSAVALSAFFFRLPTKLVVERSGMVLLAAVFLVYGTVLCVVDDAFYSTASLTMLAFGCGCGWRVYQTTRDLRLLARAGASPAPTIQDVVVRDPRSPEGGGDDQ